MGGKPLSVMTATVVPRRTPMGVFGARAAISPLARMAALSGTDVCDIAIAEVEIAAEVVVGDLPSSVLDPLGVGHVP